MNVYCLVPLTALFFSEVFHRNYFILKDYFLILLSPFLLLWILYGVFSGKKRKQKIRLTWTDLLILGMFLLLTYNYFTHRRYLETIISFHHLQFFVLLFISLRIFPLRLDRDLSRFVFSIPALIISGFTIVEKIAYPASRLKLHSTFGNPSYSSGFLLLFLPLLISIRNKWLRNTSCLLVLIGIVLLGSRIAFGIILLQALCLLKGGKGLKFGLVVLLVITFAFFNLPRLDPTSDSIAKNLKYRAETLKTGLGMFLQNPLAARGHGFVKYNFHRYHAELKDRDIPYLNTYYLHCDPLEFTIEYGLVFTLMALTVFIACIRKLDYRAVSLMGLVLYSFFSFPFSLSGIYPVAVLFVFSLSGETAAVADAELAGKSFKLVAIVLSILFICNFAIANEFFFRYMKCDAGLRKFNVSEKGSGELEELKKLFQQMPYYYDLAYRYGIGCMKNGRYPEALKVLFHVRNIRNEKTVNININNVLRHIKR